MVQNIQGLPTVQELGFESNPYNPCVANKIRQGRQCTLCWYVHDTEISHKDPNVVNWVISKIEERIGKMTVKCGTRHTFIGMDIEFKTNGTMESSLDDYVNECIKLYNTPDMKIVKH